MVDHSHSFWRNILPNAFNKIVVSDQFALRERISNASEFLSCEKNSKRVEVKIETENSQSITRLLIKLCDLGISFLEIVGVLSKQLKLEFVVDFGKLVDPIHLDQLYKYNILRNKEMENLST